MTISTNIKKYIEKGRIKLALELLLQSSENLDLDLKKRQFST